MMKRWKICGWLQIWEVPQTAAKVQNDKLFTTTLTEVQYDIIQLPSNGELSDKLDRIPVGYLTAYDETLSPHFKLIRRWF